MDACDQAAVDAKMISVDGTKNKSKLGGNAILAVSMAVARAGAAAKAVPLYQHIANLAGNKQVRAQRFFVVILEMSNSWHCQLDAAQFCQKSREVGLGVSGTV